MTDKFISLEGIAKRYPAPGGTTAVFENLWLSMNRAEFTCIIGHSGCGKTTVLNILTGPSLDRAVIFQSHALLPWRTVMGNVAYAVSSRWRKWSSAQVRAQAQKFIDLVGLTGAENGSSISIIFGSIDSARAMPTRCFIPPESSDGRAVLGAGCVDARD